MASDIYKRIYTDIIKSQEKDELKFNRINLNETIKEIYFSSIQMAFDDYLIEIENTRKKYLENTFSTEQAQLKFNIYTEEIRRKNEDDDCIYRLIKNEIQENGNEIPVEIQHELIINTICDHINKEINSYSSKLHFINNLNHQIYNSAKTHRQFLFFKNFAEKHINYDNKSDATRTHIAYYCYYTSQTKTLEINHAFPSSMAWDEIGKKFAKNSKNIQKAYNSIVNNQEERLKKTRIKTIEFVINNMLDDNKKALNLAKDELKLAESNS